MDLRQLSHDVEIISQRYAEYLNFARDDAWFLLKLQEEVCELTQAHLMRTGQARAKGLTPAEIEANFRAEFADVLCGNLKVPPPAVEHGFVVRQESLAE
jgi:NTP pyrophosphatase (non-canonical NTP hydrolase)